ncbi:MAG: hypothetical protein HYU53_01870 [Acidobacteria bacterium]|nr:hypothetical protein [Acidobacteriota bacterium]
MLLTTALVVAMLHVASSLPSQTEASVCIAMPRVQIVQGDAATAAAGLRDMFASYLTGPTLKSVALEARLASQAMEEARVKNCERVLLASLTQKRKGPSRLGKVVGEAAEGALWHVPGGYSAGSAAARSAAVAGARAISTVSSTTRARDEFRLEYRLDTADGRPILRPKTEQMKARTDGEDLLTPLVEKASEAVAAAMTAKQ